jgi:hypothetical protein
LTSLRIKLKQLVGAIVCGFLVSLASGVIENPPEASIIGAEYYGYPLAWRVTMVTMPSSINYILSSLAIDVMFWVIFSFLAVVVLRKILRKTRLSRKPPPMASMLHNSRIVQFESTSNRATLTL